MPKYPEIGDQVWFYFMHAFTDVKLYDNLWRATGKYEMRCRPAVVTALSTDVNERLYPDIRVEFACDDMTIAGSSGLARRFPLLWVSACPHIDAMMDANGRDPELIGRIIGGRWPRRDSWAWEPMPGFEGGRR
jgi:hypothetical protein